MIIEKVINNNVISAFDHKDREVVIMGRGIGFKKKSGDTVDEKKIEKKFVLNNENEIEKFAELMKSLPLEHLQVSTDIIDYAKQVMKGRLNQNIYITLTDHINFAIERFRDGMIFNNALIQEVRSFYPSEYLIGEYAIELIAKRLGIKFPVDEAVSIALHFVNAEYNTGMSETMKITSLIQEVLNIVDETFHSNMNERGLYYTRFVTHLKFLSQRIFTKQMLDNHEQEFADMIISLYPQEFECSKKIKEYIYEKYGYNITNEELAYLTIHIKRIIQNSNNN